MVYVVTLEVFIAMPIHFSKIFLVQDYNDIFLIDLAIELFKNTDLNKYAIKLINGKEPPYKPIYAFSLVELETLKAYIKTHLKTGFIQTFKSFANAVIFFDT